MWLYERTSRTQRNQTSWRTASESYIDGRDANLLLIGHDDFEGAELIRESGLLVCNKSASCEGLETAECVFQNYCCVLGVY